MTSSSDAIKSMYEYMHEYQYVMTSSSDAIKSMYEYMHEYQYVNNSGKSRNVLVAILSQPEHCHLKVVQTLHILDHIMVVVV